MQKSFRTLLTIAAVALAIFGFFCLNYTKGHNEQHNAFAAAHNLPPPSQPIFFGGVLALATGAGTIGYTIGTRGKQNK
jgi:hypothetical protein